MYGGLSVCLGCHGNAPPRPQEKMKGCAAKEKIVDMY
jgi:hypothetical protein